VIIAQISDTHVLDRQEEQFLDNNASLAAIVESLNAEQPRPDVVLATGDLTNWGRPSQYEVLSKVLSTLEIPLLPLMGNHDIRELTRQTFPEVPWTAAEHASWVSSHGGITLVGLDSTSPGVHGAVFDSERREWLESSLRAAPGPVIIALHHPPFTTGVDWMDASGFDGLAAFRGIVAAHSTKIVRIVCGHFHRPVVTTVEGVTTSVCLAGSFHVALDLRPGAGRWVIRDPRGYQLHLINGDDIVSHTRYVDTGETAFDPGWE
jgi:3',5'-cyclic-AMP phosphodiesterase